jgi:hypothetical protein
MRPRVHRVVATLGNAMAATFLIASAVLPAGSGGAAAAADAAAVCGPYACPPPIHHVVTILLENSGFATTYGVGKALGADPYLTGTLEKQGVLIPGYWATGHNSLDNYVAMISGQSPNPATQGDCDDTSTMGDSAHPGFTIDKHGQAIGVGCNYPPAAKTIADQLVGAGLSWKSYNEDMDAEPGVLRTHCQNAVYRHVQPDPYASPSSAKTPDKYKAKHNPFVYFHSLTDDQASCEAHDVPLGSVSGGAYDPFGQLKVDFSPASTPPNYSFITPNQCSDGHDICNGATALPQLNQIDTFLSKAVPIIESNPAFQPGGDGMIVIVTDEGEGESTACCGEQTGPNVPPTSTNGGLTPPGPGGGQTGALIIAPSHISGGRVDTSGTYNHYSYLRSMEDLFRLPHLGFAADYPDLANPPINPSGGPAPFGADVYDRP